MSSSWWSSTPGEGYLSLGRKNSNDVTIRETPPGTPIRGGEQSVPEGWGIAYVSQPSFDVSAPEGFVDGERDSRASRNLYGTEGFLPRLVSDPKDGARDGYSQMKAETERLYQTAPPIQKNFRAVVAFINMFVGTICVEVGLREEDSQCQATFGSLLVVVGCAQLLQSALGAYMVVQQVGIEGEDPRTCVLLVEVILWVFVAHELLLDACQNRKLPMAATVYLLATVSVWATSAAVWMAVYQKVSNVKRQAEGEQISHRRSQWSRASEGTV